jgi:hypothetical protein
MECPVCKTKCEIFCTSYYQNPFIDGRKYEFICFTCSEIPKMWDFDESTSEFILYECLSPDRLCSVAEMMEDGFDLNESQKSLQAIQKLIKKSNILVKSKSKYLILNKIFLPEIPLDYE